MSKKHCWPSMDVSYIICPHTPGAIVHLRPRLRWRWENDGERIVVWRGDITMALPWLEFPRLFRVEKKRKDNWWQLTCNK